MTGAMRKPMTIEAFLEWEAAQPLRYEFDGHRAIAMTGGTANHAYIQRNLAISIGSRLRGRPCRFVGNDLKIEVGGRVRYPDGFVFCGPAAGTIRCVTDPVVIFEVLSEATARTDLETKNHEYAATPSVCRYVVLAQDEIRATMFERLDGDWIGHLLTADSVIAMPEIGIEVPLAELYEGVELTGTAEEGASA